MPCRTSGLARETARRRLLLLLSGGKPNDDDEYEGHYGIEDTRRAVVEVRLQGIEVFCLTIDRAGSQYMPRLFGPFGYTVLPEVHLLSERPVDLYRRLTAATGLAPNGWASSRTRVQSSTAREPSRSR